MLMKENTKDWMKAHPVSNLPGRIRPSADGLKYLFEQRLEIAQALAEIPGLRRLSRATMNIVHQNFATVIGINTVGLILGAASNISVMMSALMHNASTILVVANSLRLLFMSPKER